MSSLASFQPTLHTAIKATFLKCTSHPGTLWPPWCFIIDRIESNPLSGQLGPSMLFHPSRIFHVTTLSVPSVRNSLASSCTILPGTNYSMFHSSGHIILFYFCIFMHRLPTVWNALHNFVSFCLHMT